MAIEGINQSSRTRVYKRIVTQLQEDPVLESVGVEWIAHDGTTDVSRPCVSDAPVIVLRPRLGPMQRRGPEGWKGPLLVVVDMFVPNTTDACDCMDLWTTIEDALSSPDDPERQGEFERDLMGLGCGCGGPCDAETGKIDFDQPATVDPEFDGDDFMYYRCRGSMSVSILRTITP